MTSIRSSLLARAALGLALVLNLSALTAPALAAPDDGVDRRFDKIERQLREVRDIVLQARNTGQPVEIKQAGPDPEIASLRARFDDLELTLRQMTGQIDSLGQDLAAARRESAAAQAEVRTEGERLTLIEKQLAGLMAAQAAPAPSPTAMSAAPVSKPAAAKTPAPTAPATKAPASQAKAPVNAGDPAADYARARQLMLEGQYPAASGAFQDYLDRYGDTGANAPEARYWLGQTLFVRKAYGDAAAAYIGALRGWPVKPWAPSAMVKLSMALIEMNKPVDACGALDEFGRRYQAAASAETRALAATARVRAKCS